MSVAFEVTILIAEPELSKERFDSLLMLVSEEKRERIKSFRSFKDARNCLLGDVLTRSEACRVLNLANDQIEFSQNEYGKPYFRNCQGVHFNISHSGHYIALAVDNEPVGIDIEAVKPANMKVAKRFFAPDEIEYIENAPENLRTVCFFEVWTKKESRIKHDGMGLSKPLPSFSVLDDVRSMPLFYHPVSVDDKTRCHVCSAKREPPQVRIMNALQLYDIISL